MALLRRLIDGVLSTLYRRYTEKELPALGERLGLPRPVRAAASTSAWWPA